MTEKVNIEVVEALQRGDHVAFEKVFILYFDRIKCFINGLIRSEKDAEELTQEIFVKLWMNHASIDTQKSFNALMYTMSRNTAFNYLKHKLVEQSYLKEYNPVETAEDTEEVLYAKEISLLIEMAVQRMPDKRRRIYELSRNKGFTNEEIASQLGITKKTVENQLSLALKELRHIISTFLLLFL